jgi:hypothetical protein
MFRVRTTTRFRSVVRASSRFMPWVLAVSAIMLGLALGEVLLLCLRLG